MRLLHTSDWHIGRNLYGRRRYEEFEAFLNWLAELLEREGVEALLVAGDVFDTGTPGNRAQELYYRFLCRVAESSCRHVVVIAGNHDSPSFLEAPKELLRALDVHVVGSASGDPRDEVLTLHDERGRPELIVCAVPYLRDRDLRVSEAGESLEDKTRSLLEGLRDHYAAVGEEAERRRRELGEHGDDLPIVGMGHLFAAGGETFGDDGVRDLYVGSLVRVALDAFPACFDYLALGHLHSPQRVKGCETARYSGSPIPMGFGEAGQRKSVCLAELQGREVSVRLLEVPLFQELERLRGDWKGISTRLRELKEAGSCAWLEVLYEGAELMPDLRERLEDELKGTELELLKVGNERAVESALGRIREGETLRDLDESEAFERLLESREVPEAQRPDLRLSYQEVLASLYDDDSFDEPDGSQGGEGI
ncbi:MAG: exonuclease subunit SbcD [Fretibacterium sp.]|nr:exonuclease subunit SbcD [Fretibacterium sp.]